MKVPAARPPRPVPGNSPAARWIRARKSVARASACTAPSRCFNAGSRIIPAPAAVLRGSKFPQTDETPAAAHPPRSRPRALPATAAALPRSVPPRPALRPTRAGVAARCGLRPASARSCLTPPPATPAAAPVSPRAIPRRLARSRSFPFQPPSQVAGDIPQANLQAG